MGTRYEYTRESDDQSEFRLSRNTFLPPARGPQQVFEHRRRGREVGGYTTEHFRREVSRRNLTMSSSIRDRVFDTERCIYPILETRNTAQTQGITSTNGQSFWTTHGRIQEVWYKQILLHILCVLEHKIMAPVPVSDCYPVPTRCIRHDNELVCLYGALVKTLNFVMVWMPVKALGPEEWRRVWRLSPLDGCRTA